MTSCGGNEDWSDEKVSADEEGLRPAGGEAVWKRDWCLGSCPNPRVVDEVGWQLGEVLKQLVLKT